MALFLLQLFILDDRDWDFQEKQTISVGMNHKIKLGMYLIIA